jgi:hypothetical protein
VWSFNTYYGASGYRYTIIRNGQPVRVSQKAYCTSRMAAAAARRALNR